MSNSPQPHVARPGPARVVGISRLIDFVRPHFSVATRIINGQNQTVQGMMISAFLNLFSFGVVFSERCHQKY